MALTKNKIAERQVNQVLGVLAQHFRNGKYDEGWNDRRVAAEVGVHKLLVTETRQWRLAPSTIRASGSKIGSPVASVAPTAPAPETEATAE
jgi:hypothetical protein